MSRIYKRDPDERDWVRVFKHASEQFHADRDEIVETARISPKLAARTFEAMVVARDLSQWEAIALKEAAQAVLNGER